MSRAAERGRPSDSVSKRGLKAEADEVGKVDVSYLEGTIGYAIRRAQMAVFDDIYRAFEGLSITTAQFSVLAVVADNPGLSQADLASALGVERPRMVPIIDNLETRKLAVRVTNPKDGRARLIELTPEGRKLLSELKARFARHQTRMIARLDSNKEEFLASLWRLAGAKA
ncbi:MAG: MarR family winged helix-turn-helix transcriptional regulator [Hyphomicrobiaceae bacterium]